MKKLILGNEAVARGAYEAGVKVISSYPGTPSTEITEYASKYDEIFCEWAPNEKVGLEVAIGASISGARAMSVMKHVGLNVAADPLFTSSYTGVNGGLVIAVADDPGMHSSQNEQDSRHYAKASKIMMLEPSDSQEAKDFTKLAYDLSEKFDTPVLVKLSTRISHSQSIVNMGERVEENKEFKKDFQKYVMMPAMGRKRHVIIEERMKEIKAYCESAQINRIEMGDNRIGIITSGISYQYAKEALGDKASYLKLGVVYPLPEQSIKDFACKVDKLYIAEELDPIIEEHCKSLGLEVLGKDILPITGELSAEIIREKILDERNNPTVIEENIPIRPPVMCPGCPHRGVFYTLKKLNKIVTGDIGCYTLGALPPLQAMDACVCMGASVSMAHGMEKGKDKDFSKKVVGVIGDSTFIHSGITGLIDIVYNKGLSTIMILDNSITGMTGHQDNPSTGLTIKGEPTKQVDFVKLAQSIGIERITIVDPFDLKKLENTIKEETNAEEPSLIIAQRPCALLKSVKNKGPLRINIDKCTSCKMCMKIGCPAISLRDDKVVIDSTLCNGCGLCVNVCHFSAIEKAGETNE